MIKNIFKVSMFVNFNIKPMILLLIIISHKLTNSLLKKYYNCIPQDPKQRTLYDERDSR